jgi:hypothetical protein
MAGSGTFEAVLGDHAEAAVELGSTAAPRSAALAGAAPAVVSSWRWPRNLAAGRLWNRTGLLWPRGREIPEPARRLPAVAARSG